MAAIYGWGSITKDSKIKNPDIHKDIRANTTYIRP
jgi:hypothetical protein